jgi:hypothetical protein
MAKVGLAGAVVVLAGWAIAPGWAADAGAPKIPVFAGDAASGWVQDRAFGVDDILAPPEGGPGPVTFDKAHPYVPNGRGRQPTYRVADLNNPILQDWVKPAMKKANDEVLAGAAPFRAHERCWPAGVPSIDADAVGAPLFVWQGPKEVLFVMRAGPEIRHIYLDVPHSPAPKPSWYGESVGHYEGGDTLVIDTIGFNEHPMGFIDNYRTPHSTKLHVVERWRVSADGNVVDISVLVEDPGVFTMPWRGVQRWRRARGGFEEFACAENNNVSLTDAKLFPMPQAARPDF